TTLEGPVLLRNGDRAWLTLDLENTTRGQEQLEVNFEATGAIALESKPSVSRSLALRQREDIPVEILANSAGVGRLSARASGRNSISEATIELSIPKDITYPALKAFAVQPGAASWSQTVSLQGWEQAEILVSAGLGSVLPELWLPMREQMRADPLLAALGDWAMERVRSHHGITASTSTQSRDLLLERLQHYSSGGGWAWTPGHPPDPWMTAMILWSLETFASLSDDAFDTMRAEAREFLESVLIEEGVAMDVRLFALHALASPAYNDPRVRPSRIQARSFLSLLHDRAQLSNAGFATLLQVARAYRFTEEVRLLSPELIERVRNRGIPVESGFWSRTLIFMAFGEIRNADALRGTILQGAIENLSNTGVRRSWLQFGGLLNLLATFLWEGDFNAEGSAVLQLDGAEPSVLDLKPDGPHDGRIIVEYPMTSDQPREVSLRLDTSAARVPVIVAVLGQRSIPPAYPPFPEQSEQLLREFVEETLLAGQRQEIRDLQENPVLQPGDVLQVILSLYVEDPEAFGEFHFSIPAGASLPPDAIQHSFEPSSTEALFEPPVLSYVEQPDPFRQVIRMESLAPGRHEFILSYRINWSGTFAFPPHRLYIPKTGQAYQIGKPWWMEVAL
ncbi:MAG TPA: hypothetical protein VK995_05105, partial [Oceanipulchritudo sp.]|nr:hypothetical protein [Oceanipulchritudo sp.]